MKWKNEWDLQILLDLSFGEKEAGELADILKFDDHDLPDKKGLPDLIFLYDEEYLKLWKAEKYHSFRNNAIDLLRGNQAYAVLSIWQQKVDTIDSWQRRIEQLQTSAEKRIKNLENNAVVKWDVESEQIPDRLREIVLQLKEDEEYWAGLSVEELESSLEGRQRLELDKLESLLGDVIAERKNWQERHSILRELVLVMMLYEYKCEILQQSLREYEASGVKPRPPKKPRRPSARMLQRVRNAYCLLKNESERLPGTKELNAALAELENSQKGNLVKQLDAFIEYKEKPGNDERKNLCKAKLIIWDPESLEKCEEK